MTRISVICKEWQLLRKNKISKTTDFCQRFSYRDSVPDPYYGGDSGFELVLDLLEDAVEGLLDQLENK